MKWKTLRTHCGECKLIIVVRKNRVVIVCNNVHCVTSHGFRLLWFENYWVSKMTYLGFQKYPQTPSYASHVFNHFFPSCFSMYETFVGILVLSRTKSVPRNGISIGIFFCCAKRVLAQLSVSKLDEIPYRTQFYLRNSWGWWKR